MLVNIYTWVKDNVPEQKAQQFYDHFRKINGEGWINFDSDDLFIIKQVVMNKVKLRRRGE